LRRQIALALPLSEAYLVFNMKILCHRFALHVTVALSYKNMLGVSVSFEVGWPTPVCQHCPNYAENMPSVHEISVRKNYSFSVSTVSLQNYFENLSYVPSKIRVNALRKSVYINIYGAD